MLVLGLVRGGGGEGESAEGEEGEEGGEVHDGGFGVGLWDCGIVLVVGLGVKMVDGRVRVGSECGG